MLDRVNTTSDNISKPESMGSSEDSETHQFMAERNEMLENAKVGAAEANNKGLVQLKPMTPLAASSTVVNLLLATGPFA
jgi:hypothetical protein